MSSRLWLLLVFALASVFAPSRTCAYAAETRTGDFLSEVNEVRPESAAQVADSHLANTVFGYETVSGYALAAENIGVNATREGLIDVSQHLSQFGVEPTNAAMYERLTTAFESGQPLTGADATFYQHELIESGLMDGGMDARAAHLETLRIQGIDYAPGYEAPPRF
jgi:hypothetical protein